MALKVYNKILAIFSIIMVSAIYFSACARHNNEPVNYVVPFIGTTADLGNTFPGACVPFGMIQLSPDVSTDYCSGYNYKSNSIEGFSCTHLSGTGCKDYGNVLFMPTIGKLEINPGTENGVENGYRSEIDKTSEKASPGYYSVFLKKYNIKVELTTTTRAGILRCTFPETKDAHVLIDLSHRNGGKVKSANVKILDNHTIEGYCHCDESGGGWCGGSDYSVYFYAKFSKPFTSYGTWNGTNIHANNKEESGEKIGTYVNFNTSNNEPVQIKVGISFVDVEGAKKNLEAEIPDWNFEKVSSEARKLWNKKLSKIEIKGGTNNQKKIFYTALYHTLIHPNIFSDVDGRYYGMDHQIHVTDTQHPHHAIFSGWDIFRAEMPLLTIIEPSTVNDIVRSLLSKYKEGGWLPIWEFANSYSNCMVGDPAVPVIVDAYTKGIKNFDVEEAYQAMKKSALKLPPPEHHFKGRRGLTEYEKLGYIPYQTPGVWGSVSTTLEYAYVDWCIARMAKSLDQDDDYNYFMKRSKYYKNLFDKSTGFMRPKDKHGAWIKPFDPLLWEHGFVESNSWQQTWFVPHDVQGLVNLMGKELFINRLDTLFESASTYDFSKGFGKYRYYHGNEPDQHVVYLYDYVGEPWKTQKWSRAIVEKAYGAGADGICGNDDCGQTSAWYVFSAMGFYPVCPGNLTYQIGSPIFDKITIHLDKKYYHGDKFTIKVDNGSQENLYIRSATLNGKTWNKPWLPHSAILNGEILEFEMSKEPNKDWGREY